MKRVLVACALGALLAGCGGTAMYAPTPVITISATGAAPDSRVGTTVLPPVGRGSPLILSGSDAAGAPVDVASYRGKVVVLNAWASWCAPCREEIPQLRQAYDATHAEGAEFLGLNVSDDPSAAAGFGFPYPSIVDRDGQLLPTIPGVPPAALPSTVILDRQGRVAVRIIGPVADGELTPLIQSVLAEP